MRKFSNIYFMKKFPISRIISEFASIFEQNGFKLYVVGGAVRDYLLGVDNHDFDFCTDALPEQIISIFKSVIQTGIKHGTVTVLFKGEAFEVTTFRTESNYSDKRHPDKVSFVSSLEEDLSRRDFTVNAFAADCKTGEIIDLFNGIEDLNRKLLKAIGNPTERFNEDALRLLRMCRFAAKLNFEVDLQTFSSSKTLSHTINFISEERITDEMSKLLMSNNPSKGLKLLDECGLLKEIYPILYECKSIEQQKINSNNVFEHIVNSVQAAADNHYSLTVRWALLFHDVGKVKCVKEETNVIHFYNHENVSAEMAFNILKHYKFSNQMQEDITVLIRNHMIKYDTNWSDGAVKRFINRIGKERINSLFELQWCDQIASEGYSKVDEYGEFINRIEKCLTEPLSIKDLCINGDDLNKIGIPKNKVMGEILNKLLENVIDEPKLNTKENLLKIAKSMYQI